MTHRQPKTKTPFVPVGAVRWVRAAHPGLALAAAALLTLALIFPAAASAGPRYGAGNTGIAEFASGSIGRSLGLAASEKEGGDLYLADEGNDRIDQFQPDGAFVRAFGWGIVPGAATGAGDLTEGSALVTEAITTSGRFLEGDLIAGPGIPPDTKIRFVSATELKLTQPVEANQTHIGATITVTAAPGNVPVNEVQKLTVKAISGTYTLAFTSPKPGTTTDVTAGISATAGHDEVQSALEALPNVGPGNVAVSGGPGDESGVHPYLIEFKGRYADVNVLPLSSSSALAGGSPSSEAALATTQEGGGAVESCTSVCGRPSANENVIEQGQGFGGANPGQLRGVDEIAVDNSCAQQEPPLTGSACESFDPSYSDVYVVDADNFRVEKYSPSGEFLLMFGGGVDQGPHHPGNLCTAAFIAEGDQCGAGEPGAGPAHFYEEDPRTEAGGSKTWAQIGDNSIALGPDGTVYVGDYGRIQEFGPDGAFEGEFTLPLEGKGPQFVAALAVDSAGDIYERSDVYASNSTTHEAEVLSQVPGVREFSPAHVLLRTFDAEEAASEPTHIALDPAGDLFVSDYHNAPFEETATCILGGNQVTSGCPEETFRAFKPNGDLFAEFTSDQVRLRRSKPDPGLPGGLALDAATGELYVTASETKKQPGGGQSEEEHYFTAVAPPVPGPPLVDEQHVTDIGHTTATLNATVNPEQFDTSYRFQWVTKSHFEAEGFADPQQSPPTDLGSVSRPDQVQTLASGLVKGTIYRWRVLAVNHCNEAEPALECRAEGELNAGEEVPQEFESLPPVSLREFNTQTVAPEFVELKAQLNANGSPTASHYTFCIGEHEGDYSLGCSEGSLPPGQGFEEVNATFASLKPNTPYHYHLSAENEEGKSESGDQEFRTEETIAEQDAREGCANALLREENNSLALPDCRAYEQVSAADKEGGEAYPRASLGPGGERLLYQSSGVFAGALANGGTIQYLAQRTAAGWSTRPVVSRLAPPGTESVLSEGNLLFSPELDRWLFSQIPARDYEEALFKGTGFYLSMGLASGADVIHASPAFSLLEGPPRSSFALLTTNYTLAAEDLSTVYALNRTRLLASDPRPDEYATHGRTDQASRIYELSGLGGPSPAVALIAELPEGLDASGGCEFDGTTGHNEDIFQHREERLVSADGATLIYTGPIMHVAGRPCGDETPNPVVLFAHHHGETGSIQLSTPPPSQCHSGHPCSGSTSLSPTVDGISPDGRRVWFSTAQPLVDSDSDNTRDLYLAKLTESGRLEELVQASAGETNPEHPVPGQGAGVQGVLEVSPDGSHVAFVATGVLTTTVNALGKSATQGADNVYVYDAAGGQVKYVARLCSATGKSGSLADPSCFQGSAEEPWRPFSFATRSAAFTPDGRYLLLSSRDRLTPDDTDTATDAYRYDFQTGQLIRISIGRRGNDADGNDNAFPVEIGPKSEGGLGVANELAEDSSRAISSDGSTVIFETAAPLVSRDTNTGPNPGCSAEHTGCDIYQWEENGHRSCREPAGCVSLVSDGVDPHGSRLGIIGSSGGDITFFTQRGEAPGDTDGVGDIYDARIGGGFPYAPPEKPCGSNETCHHEAPPVPAPARITSAGETGGNGLQQLQCAKGKVRVTKHGQVRCVAKKHHKAKHKKHKRANTNRRAGR